MSIYVRQIGKIRMISKRFYAVCGVMAFILCLSMPIHAMIKTNLQTDFNIISKGGSTQASVGAYKMFYRAQAQKEMMLLTEMVYQQNESLTSANSAADERFYIERLFILYTLSQNFQFKIEDFIRKSDTGIQPLNEVVILSRLQHVRSFLSHCIFL